MTIQDRKTLKMLFKAGARPTEADFAALIDSTLVMDDEGFQKTLEDGLRITTKGGSTALLSFRQYASAEAEWSIGFPNSQSRCLQLRGGPLVDTSPTIVAFDMYQDQNTRAIAPRVRVGTSLSPQAAELDVVGAISSDGRMGREHKSVAADGQWHDISERLSGCVAIEVMAGVGLPGTGHFALVRAIAMNLYNPPWWETPFSGKKPIRRQDAWYSRGVDRLVLRWEPRPEETAPAPAPPITSLLANPQKLFESLFNWRKQVNKMYGLESHYVLQIKSRSNYGDGQPATPNIRVFTTKLWYDPFMTPATATPFPNTANGG